MGVRLTEWWRKELEKSSAPPKKTVIKMDTIFESNKFNTLEIEQGDTRHGEAFAKKQNKTKKLLNLR